MGFHIQSTSNSACIPPEYEQACNDYLQYIRAICRPAMTQLEHDVSTEKVALHQVFGANLLIAHAIDYIQAIRRADNIQENRTDLVNKFDQIFSVTGARLRNRKFALIDAINNALKHIRLNPDRYKHLEQRYGTISFQALVPENGRVLCILENYRFDYARVVLPPAYHALAGWDLITTADILAFARGEVDINEGPLDNRLMALDDPEDAIDKMIAYCNPTCEDCGEQESDCYCAEFIYDGEQGRFEPRFQADFDFDAIMSQISGSYHRS